MQFRIRFSVKDQWHFAKRLAYLTGSGMGLMEALLMLEKQNKSKSKQKIYSSIVKDVSNGQFLSTSLKKQKGVFGDFAIHIIEIGEASGILTQNLNYLSDELQKRNELKRKVQGALMYPIFITAATIGVTVLLTVYIFPKLLPIFKGVHVVLPLSTRLLIWASDTVRHYGLYIALFAAVLCSAFVFFLKKSEQFSLFVSGLLLRTPILKKILQSFAMANFARTLGLLLKSGVTITDALTITANTASNPAYRHELRKFSERIASGEKLSSSLGRSPLLFPDVSVHMIAIGETAGNLGDILLYLASMHEEEVNEATRNLSSSIEPILMLTMGLVVGFVAISIITPIYEITRNLSR